jgi:serine O-acetyltransferase
MSEYAHRITGTDIMQDHNRLSIFIDHATGIVIGKQQSLKRVKIYQGVTLGALSVSKDMKDAKDILQWRQTFAFMLMRPF